MRNFDANGPFRTALPKVAVDYFRVPGIDPAVTIHLRHKRLAGDLPRGEHPVVIFVHGATYPGTVVFDHAMFGGGSWLDYMAVHGFDAYSFDVRGYGLSSRPAEFGEGSRRGLPYARTPDAIADLKAVVDFVRARTPRSKVNLVGWSWGTAIAGGFASKYGELVRHIVMVSPLWIIRNSPVSAMSRWMTSAVPTLLQSGDLLGAYRSISKSEARRRWVRGLEPDVAEQLMPRAEFDGWWRALANVQGNDDESSESVEAPNGVMADLVDVWSAGQATYTPESISSPTLLLVGEWDVDTPAYMAQEIFSRLKGASYKRLEVLARGTHSMALEVNRVDLYRRTREFLQTRFI
ncbi:alpha/beta fold hydrolase [Variovorax ureilyticus]|uniref:Alpha/beta fold hydrolase n=1 Tax=Variovorax ureilyticus TaxID=1836198 RepID=A0ABU8VKT9_9BURK